MNEFMYGIDSVWIALALLALMLAALEAGHRLGLRRAASSEELFRTHVKGIAASQLGILALLLGFTFSLSLQRFDNRSEAVVDEANAIGTAWLRAQLLPAAARAETQALLRQYADSRVKSATISLADGAARDLGVAEAGRLQAELWSIAVRAVAQEPSPVTTGLYMQSLNELIDAFSRRDAALDQHVPELVLLLLYATFVATGAIVGYAAGVSGHRPSFAAHVMVLLIVVLVFIILDLDRPRRGLIQVTQKPLIELQATMRAVR